MNYIVLNGIRTQDDELVHQPTVHTTQRRPTMTRGYTDHLITNSPSRLPWPGNGAEPGWKPGQGSCRGHVREWVVQSRRATRD
jgi:hypothetical protein